MATRGFNKAFNLQNLGLAGLVEAIAIVQFLPGHISKDNPLLWILLRVLGLHLVFYCVFWGLINPYVFSAIRHFPQPKVITGITMNTSSIANSSEAYTARAAYFDYMGKKPPGQHFLEWSEATPNDGLLLLRSPFNKSRLLVTKPRALADLLVTNAYDFVKPKRIRDFLRKVLGDGLIIVEGDVHKFQRKHAMPAFSFRPIKDLYPMMFQKAVALTQAISADLAEQPQGDEKTMSGKTEINSWASKVTLDIIGIAGMGKELNVLKNSDDPLVHDYEELLEPTGEKFLFFALSAFASRGVVKLFPWRMNEVFERCTTSLASICANLVREKRAAMKTGSDQHFDILSLLIRSNDFSDPQLVDQLLTFLAAGHETTSSALTWASYLLAKNPSIQTRLRAEIREAFPTNPCSDPNIDIAGILERLPLLNGVCNETLRLYPTVPITMRIAIRDTRLLDQPVPRGTEILLSPWAVNRSQELWGDDAREFVPERWIDGDKVNNNGGALSNYSFLTFLHGPRGCIGQGFAKAELRCLVAAFVGSFEWELNMKEEDIIPAGVVTIKPKNGLHLKLRIVGTW